jgi:OPT family oligopeptide transporter
LLIAVIYVVPAGIIQAITNQTIALNILAEFIIGYAVPGRPVANMIFKTYCFFTAYQANAFTVDLKLGHYMKIPPRVMFWAQMLGSIVCCFVVLGVQQWMIANVEDLCAPNQKDFFVCPSTTTFYTASLLWGAVGPQRLFSVGQIYSPLLWFFLIGFLLPFPFYYAARRYPRSFLRYVNFPVFFNGANALPPASGINYSSWFLVGFIFQFIMRRRHFRWWLRYNYLLSAAMDSGVAISLILIFFCLQMPRGGINLNWWGNTVWQKTADANGIAYIPLAPNTTFGPPPVGIPFCYY